MPAARNARALTSGSPSRASARSRASCPSAVCPVHCQVCARLAARRSSPSASAESCSHCSPARRMLVIDLHPRPQLLLVTPSSHGLVDLGCLAANHSAWRCLSSSSSSDSPSFSVAYSRIVSSIVKRSSRRRMRLLSSSDSSVSSSASVTVLCRLQRAAPGEDGETGEEPLLFRREQLVGPVDRRSAASAVGDPRPACP